MSGRLAEAVREARDAPYAWDVVRSARLLKRASRAREHRAARGRLLRSVALGATATVFAAALLLRPALGGTPSAEELAAEDAHSSPRVARAFVSDDGGYGRD